MKKIIGLALVSAMVGVLPLVASAQMTQGSTESTTKTTTTKEPNGQSYSKTSHTHKHLAPGEKGMNETKTTTKEVSHKYSGPASETTTTTKKPMHKASTKTVKTGHSAVKESHEKTPCNVKESGKKTTTHKTTMTDTGKKEETTTTTGKSEVKEAPNTAPEKKEGPMQKVEQGVKKTGEDIHQGWDKMIHHDQNQPQNKQ